jgi:hypothetical protein
LIAEYIVVTYRGYLSGGWLMLLELIGKALSDVLKIIQPSLVNGFDAMVSSALK